MALAWLRRRAKKPEAAPPVYFHNTLSGTTEEFTPLLPGRVRMYNCGPTVYDYQHLGNMRPYVFADVLRRVLESSGFRVKQVINITDVGHLTGDNLGDADTGEDKVEKRAREEGERVSSIVSRVVNAYFEDLDRLLVERRHLTFAKATDHIREQIALIRTLEEKGYTYTIADGVYFDTAKFPGYGKLGKIPLQGLREGARVEENKEKRHPTDFALWKFSPKDVERQQEWDSPWGVGFPGWHIECSAMAMTLLGNQIDIHTGGIDHIPIHHNNEIAQSEAASGKTFARFWLHNAFITVEGRKISKSLGNVIYLRHLIERGFSPIAYRLWLLGAHYRSPINFTWEALESSHTALVRLHRFFVEELPARTGSPIPDFSERFMRAVRNDLNTPEALSILWELVHAKGHEPSDVRATLLQFDAVLGLGLSTASAKLLRILAGKEHRLVVAEAPGDVQKLVASREVARGEKNFAEADRLREQIAKQGFIIEDTPEGPRLHKQG